MWLIAGIVSLGPQSGRAWSCCGRSAPRRRVAPVLLIGAAIFDIALGVLTLLPRRPPLLWTAQILLVLVYTAIISVFLPELWLEPFGPVAKNMPILVAAVAAAAPGGTPMTYLLVKWLHILSSTLLFGTGLGSAFYMYFTSRTRNPQAIAVVVR